MAINLFPPDRHDADARIEVVPAAALVEPAVGGRGQRGDAMTLESIQTGRGCASDSSARRLSGPREV